MGNGEHDRFSTVHTQYSVLQNRFLPRYNNWFIARTCHRCDTPAATCHSSIQCNVSERNITWILQSRLRRLAELKVFRQTLLLPIYHHVTFISHNCFLGRTPWEKLLVESYYNI